MKDYREMFATKINNVHTTNFLSDEIHALVLFVTLAHFEVLSGCCNVNLYAPVRNKSILCLFFINSEVICSQ